MTLSGSAPVELEFAAPLRETAPEKLFPGAHSAKAALVGIWLYLSALDEGHNLTQEIPTPEGSFWHGIMHRREPDPGNAAYWFRRVGAHPVYPDLCQAARDIALRYPQVEFRAGSSWDPFAFIDFCERARACPGSEQEAMALEIQLAEWTLLFDHCARPAA